MIIFCRSRRSIYPNQGFLSQLCDLEYELKRSSSISSTYASDPEPVKEKPIKDSVYNPALHADHRPTFTSFNSRNYSSPYNSKVLTTSGYPVSSAYYDSETGSRIRARSEERAARSYYDYTRSRSASPPPSSFRTYRATSMMPDASDYEDRPRYSYSSLVPSTTRYVSPRSSSAFSGYDSTGQRYYYSNSSPESFTYTPRIRSRPLTDSYLRTRYTLPENSYSSSFITREPSFPSTSPYESYSMISSHGNRSFQTYTRQMDSPSSRISGSLSSSLRYPALYPATHRHSYLTSLKAC